MEKFVSISDVGELYMGEIFEWYDGPKLFTLNKKDSKEPLFLSYWIGDEEEYESWVIIPLDEKRIQKYKNNEIDFLKFLNVFSKEKIYRLTYTYKNQEDKLTIMSADEISSIMWPKEGLYFNRK